MRRTASSTMTDYLTDETLYVLSPDLLQPGGQQSVEALKTWSIIQGEKVRERLAKQRCLAETRHAQAEKDQQDAAATLAAVRAEQNALPSPYWIKAALFLACACAGLAAEYALTNLTLPFILDMKRSSILAIVLSLSPVGATLVLDTIFDRLIERPWLQARLAVLRGRSHEERQRVERRMEIFLVALWFLCVSMFLALGIARMDAVHWQTALATAEPTAEVVSLVSVDLALIVFSIGVLITTAWLLLLGLNHARHCARYVGAARRLRRQMQRFYIAREVATEAAGEVARWRIKDAQSHRLTSLAAQWLFAYQVLRIKSCHVTHPDLAQRVDRALAQLGLTVRPAAS